VRALTLALALALPGCGGGISLSKIGQTADRWAAQVDAAADSSGQAAWRICHRLRPDLCPPKGWRELCAPAKMNQNPAPAAPETGGAAPSGE